MDAPGEIFRERLRVPLRWWVQGSMFVASLWIAMIVSLPHAIAWVATAVAMAVLAAMFLSYGASQIVVASGWLRVGRARIEGRHLGAALALDAEETRRVAGPQADARAFLVLRPYLKRAVRIGIEDPADPAPYWLVSTRHPDLLAAALSSLSAAPRTREG